MKHTFLLARRAAALVAASAAMLAAVPAHAHAIEGCPSGSYLYHFGFADWRKTGTAWQARDSDYAHTPSGLSVFLDLTESEYRKMNQARSDELGAVSVVLRVPCDNSYSKNLTLTANPVTLSNWVSEGGSKHAVLSIKGSNPSAEKFNQAFQNELINHSSLMATER
ncbi:hypothetical protein C0Q88_24910 [Ralstonia pickettii]|uniref:Uncharacterized protein n=1 Tax=Ralstonia pickettii TaxID=329 RepID=A0A2N4TJQ8_RALPI|nr:hypothetical protein [Ralstonia pickettii]PLC39943.1 hypothetical protein C0Q88_24910 [Ralstonia pickettii]